VPKYILNEIQLSETAFRMAVKQARVGTGLYPCVVSWAENLETCYEIGYVRIHKEFERFFKNFLRFDMDMSYARMVLTVRCKILHCKM
jgi:hypothetical protein